MMADSIIIESDDAELVPLLRDLERQVTDAGGYLSPQLKIVVDQGQIRVESDAQEAALLVRIPESCLPVIDGIDFCLSDGRLAVAAGADDIGPSQRRVLDTMLAIYNRGDKLSAHRRESLWLALADQPTLLEKLHDGRRDAPKVTHHYESARHGGGDDLLIESYLGARTLRYRLDEDHTGRVLMPFIDFFNHHSASPSFGIGQQALTVQASHPLPGSAECFVSYNRLDAFDALLNYGFADTSAPFVRSVPLRFDLPDGGVVQVLGRVGQAKKKIVAKELGFLRGWLPRFHRTAEGVIVANHLLIPRVSQIDILANVLAMLFAPMMPAADRDALNRLVQTALGTVIRVNREYYRSLDELVGTVPETVANHQALAELRRALAHQSAWLDEWDKVLAAAAHAVAVPHTGGLGAAWS
jgi:hypothetical protein